MRVSVSPESNHMNQILFKLYELGKLTEMPLGHFVTEMYYLLNHLKCICNAQKLNIFDCEENLLFSSSQSVLIRTYNYFSLLYYDSAIDMFKLQHNLQT